MNILPMPTCLKNNLGLSLLTLAAQFALQPGACAADVAIGRFSDRDYGDWKLTGTAFQPGPVSGSQLSRLEIENANGVVASSEIDGDAPVGTLTSPEFKLSQRYIAFRIGGGNYERDT